MNGWDEVDTKTPTKERTELYTLMVQYFIYVDKLTIDAAHKKVDAMYKWFKENES